MLFCIALVGNSSLWWAIHAVYEGPWGCAALWKSWRMHLLSHNHLCATVLHHYNAQLSAWLNLPHDRLLFVWLFVMSILTHSNPLRFCNWNCYIHKPSSLLFPNRKMFSALIWWCVFLLLSWQSLHLTIQGVTAPLFLLLLQGCCLISVNILGVYGGNTSWLDTVGPDPANKYLNLPFGQVFVRRLIVLLCLYAKKEAGASSLINLAQHRDRRQEETASLAHIVLHTNSLLSCSF